MDVPFRVLNDFNLESSGRLLMLYSGLGVNNAFNLRGIADQEGSVVVFTNSKLSEPDSDTRRQGWLDGDFAIWFWADSPPPDASRRVDRVEVLWQKM